MSKDPEETLGPFSAHEVHEYLKKQIEMFSWLAMPDGKISSEGLNKAKHLIKAQMLPIGKKPTVTPTNEQVKPEDKEKP